MKNFNNERVLEIFTGTPAPRTDADAIKIASSFFREHQLVERSVPDDLLAKLCSESTCQVLEPFSLFCVQGMVSQGHMLLLDGEVEAFAAFNSEMTKTLGNTVVSNQMIQNLRSENVHALLGNKMRTFKGPSSFVHGISRGKRRCYSCISLTAAILLHVQPSLYKECLEKSEAHMNVMHTARTEMLKSLGLCQHWDMCRFSQAANELNRIQVCIGETLIFQDSNVDCAYFVDTGELRMVRKKPSEKDCHQVSNLPEGMLYVAQHGNIIGDIELVQDSRTWLYTAIAKDNCKVYVMPARFFRTFFMATDEPQTLEALQKRVDHKLKLISQFTKSTCTTQKTEVKLKKMDSFLAFATRNGTVAIAPVDEKIQVTENCASKGQTQKSFTRPSIIAPTRSLSKHGFNSKLHLSFGSLTGTSQNKDTNALSQLFSDIASPVSEREAKSFLVEGKFEKIYKPGNTEDYKGLTDRASMRQTQTNSSGETSHESRMKEQKVPILHTNTLGHGLQQWVRTARNRTSSRREQESALTRTARDRETSTMHSSRTSANSCRGSRMKTSGRQSSLGPDTDRREMQQTTENSQSFSLRVVIPLPENTLPIKDASLNQDVVHGQQSSRAVQSDQASFLQRQSSQPRLKSGGRFGFPSTSRRVSSQLSDTENEKGHHTANPSFLTRCSSRRRLTTGEQNLTPSAASREPAQQSDLCCSAEMKHSPIVGKAFKRLHRAATDIDQQVVAEEEKYDAENSTSYRNSEMKHSPIVGKASKRLLRAATDIDQQVVEEEEKYDAENSTSYDNSGLKTTRNNNPTCIQPTGRRKQRAATATEMGSLTQKTARSPSPASSLLVTSEQQGSPGLRKIQSSKTLQRTESATEMGSLTQKAARSPSPALPLLITSEQQGSPCLRKTQSSKALQITESDKALSPLKTARFPSPTTPAPGISAEQQRSSPLLQVQCSKIRQRTISGFSLVNGRVCPAEYSEVEKVPDKHVGDGLTTAREQNSHLRPFSSSSSSRCIQLHIAQEQNPKIYDKESPLLNSARINDLQYLHITSKIQEKCAANAVLKDSTLDDTFAPAFEIADAKATSTTTGNDLIERSDEPNRKPPSPLFIIKFKVQGKIREVAYFEGQNPLEAAENFVVEQNVENDSKKDAYIEAINSAILLRLRMHTKEHVSPINKDLNSLSN